MITNRPLTEMMQATIRERLKARQKECQKLISESILCVNRHGDTITPTTAQTKRTRALRDKYILQLLLELFNCLHNGGAKVMLGEDAQKGLDKMLYPVQRS